MIRSNLSRYRSDLQLIYVDIINGATPRLKDKYAIGCCWIVIPMKFITFVVLIKSFETYLVHLIQRHLINVPVVDSILGLHILAKPLRLGSPYLRLRFGRVYVLAGVC